MRYFTRTCGLELLLIVIIISTIIIISIVILLVLLLLLLLSLLLLLYSLHITSCAFTAPAGLQLRAAVSVEAKYPRAVQKSCFLSSLSKVRAMPPIRPYPLEPPASQARPPALNSFSWIAILWHFAIFCYMIFAHLESMSTQTMVPESHDEKVRARRECVRAHCNNANPLNPPRGAGSPLRSTGNLTARVPPRRSSCRTRLQSGFQGLWDCFEFRARFGGLGGLT